MARVLSTTGKNLHKLVGIDLGTGRLRIWSNQDDEIIDEATCLAVESYSGKVVAVGDEALAMRGRVGEQIEVVLPVSHGEIARIDHTRALLRVLLQRIFRRIWFWKPTMMITLPVGSSVATRDVTAELLYSLGAREVLTISQPLAAAIGAGVPIADASGSFVVQLGSGVVEAAITSLGSIIDSESIRWGGDRLDQRLQLAVRDRYLLEISLETARRLKHQVGTLILESDKEMVVSGHDLGATALKEVVVTGSSLEPVMSQEISRFERSVRNLLSRIPPELTTDVIDKGILLSGGLAQLDSLDEYLINRLAVPASVVDEPEQTAIKGVVTALENIEEFKRSLGYATTRYNPV